MAKKKQKPTGKPPKSPRKPASKASPPNPDRRALESTLHDFLKLLAGAPGDAPLDAAQELMYKAFDAPSVPEQLQFARMALEISPDCADAYGLLAEHAQSHKETLDLYRKAVEAGERALGPKAFRDDVGHFWGVFETRPYMRVKLGLAEALWATGHRPEAVEQLQEMLRLNPNDNQGVRYILASWLVNLDRDDDLERLLEQYEHDGMATWHYTRALLNFRREGDTPRSRELLKIAKKVNKHVPAYLLGEKPLPPDPPDYYAMGDVNEATMYVGMGGALGAWKATPGAIAWLRQTKRGGKKRRNEAPKGQGPLPLIKKRLLRLPQQFDIWQVGARPLATWIESDGERVRPWAALVVSRSHGLILANSITDGALSSEMLWDLLVAAMEEPAMGPPHRPTTIELRSDELAPHLDEIGVECDVPEELDQLDIVLGELEEQMTRDEPPGLLEMPGVSAERVAGFYRAAAEFYRRAPWRSLGYEAAIKVECDQFNSGPWYAVVMGQSGLTFGVALYDDIELLLQLWEGHLSDVENAHRTVALSLTYGEETDLPFADLDAGRSLGWEVAGPEAYPTLFRKEPGMSMRPPLAWELALMEGCLQAIPEFISRHTMDDATNERITVPSASGKLSLNLSWVDE